MTSKELRQKYQDFFKAKGHQVVASASLIPENDPTVLFTTAGMHPLVPYLLGENHPAGSRLTSCQKCIRTGDIDDVGDPTHLTFFEMLGNWSLGDYFKQDAIKYSYEFLTEILGLEKSKLAFTVFAGDNNAPFDEESYNIWLSLGVSEKRIAKLGKEDNWWGPAGQTGPCGPDTEMFYWTGEGQAPEVYDPQNKLWVEIWNNVFMAYNKDKNNNYSELAQKNVDTGMGLERTLCVINNISDIYKTDLFADIISKIQDLTGKNYQENIKAFRIIADHIKAAVLIMGDNKGIAPSNTDQGYIVRRLIRRALRYGRQLNLTTEPWTTEIAQVVIEIYGDIYPELIKNKKNILDNLNHEENKFKITLETGLREFAKIKGELTGLEAFNLYQTYGFPVEMTEELAREQNLKINLEEFNQELAKHQELSRTAAAGKFKGGLADHGEETTKLHTATHLLLAALRKILGPEVHQKGSNITAERLRLDFSWPDKLTPEQIKQVEDLVNQAIQDKLPVIKQEMTLEKAKAMGAEGVFESKYQEIVSVYTVGDSAAPYSREICGGPHVSNTSELGKFKIVKEEASSQGVRRIKAVLEA